MKFWDSSAVVQRPVEQPGSAALRALLGVDPVVVAGWGAPVECVSAIARLDLLAEAWVQVEPGPALQQLARRLLRTHPLRAAADGEPRRLPFVCLDERLRVAADREGLPLV